MCIRDRFGKKPNVDIRSMANLTNPTTGEPVGFYLVSYNVDHAAPGEIDYSRKLFLQRPKCTLAVNMIAGPNAENTMRWSLESVKGVANEIVIGDTGMSPTALAIAEEYATLIVPCEDVRQTGFDVARNRVLEATASDFVLWIDTDERLMDAPYLAKYLRHSMYNGYCLRQNHFAVDAGFPADTPLRLMRTDKGLKFIGRIHEHPELDVNEGAGDALIVGDTCIAHIGYLVESTRRQRFARNAPLLQLDAQDYPNRILQKHMLMRDKILLAGFIFEESGNRIVPEVTHLAQEVSDLYHEHFHGKDMPYKNIDSLQYYTRALEFLGKGIQVAYDLRANRDGHGDSLNGGSQLYQARFANADEAVSVISKAVRERFDPLLGEDF
jgi:glycosyltransferase involved in cell wall biosynthesis